MRAMDLPLHAEPEKAAREAPPPTADPQASADEVGPWLERWLDEREQAPKLREAIRYALFAGGKRVRPRLVLESARSVGGRDEDALPAAGAIELVHCFSLVHDDLPALDDDDLRRGRPTLHKHAGEALAILAGDALLTLAFELIATRVRDDARAGALCRELALGTNAMITGQVYDTLPDWDPSLPPLERLRTIHANKTGALIRTACRLGGLSAGASDAELDALSRYGRAVGLMFQVVDDVLDVTQTTEHLGKAANKDEARGKLTYPGLLGLEESRRIVAALRAEAREALAPLGSRAEPLERFSEWLAVRTH